MRIGTQANRTLLFAGDVQERFQFRFASEHLFDESDQFGFVSLLQNRVYVLLFKKVLRLVYPSKEQRGGMFTPHAYRTRAYGIYYTLGVEVYLYPISICL